MGVYIKGMRMPENCEKCPFLIEEDIDFDICRQCGAGKNGYIYEEDIDGFPADCPLIDLGKHGRLIDADKLMDDIKKNSASYFADDFAREWVDLQPTVIEAEDGT